MGFQGANINPLEVGHFVQDFTSPGTVETILFIIGCPPNAVVIIQIDNVFAVFTNQAFNDLSMNEFFVALNQFREADVSSLEIRFRGVRERWIAHGGLLQMRLLKRIYTATGRS